MGDEIPKKLLERIKEVSAKRPRTVLEHVVKHGHITTEELKENYRYNHPPRAARDVREHGIALETYKVEDSTGRVIAGYRLDLKTAPSRGTLCGGKFDPTFLQVDHKVPYEVAGESEAENADAFMLVCGSCNRTKSWAGEHCEN